MVRTRTPSESNALNKESISKETTPAESNHTKPKQRKIKNKKCCLRAMPNTYSQIYIHLVFAVKYRQSLINESWETELYKYINGVIQNKGQLPIAINGMPDHIHILFIMKPTCCISDLVREIKKSSTEFIAVKGFVRTKFQWQNGFGAFSYSQSSLNNVKRYIENQKQHHAVKTFKREYQEFLSMFDIEYNQDYLFDWILEK